jgi:hypothetical protein
VRTNVTVFTEGFKNKMALGEEDIAELSARFMDDSLRLTGLNKPPTAIISEDLIATNVPMTNTFVEFFGDDMAKILRGDISIGLIRGESVNEVVNRVRDSFKASNMSYGRAERIVRTEMLRASSIAQQKRAEEVKQYNPSARKMWIHNPSAEPRAGHIEAQDRYRENPIDVDALFRVRKDSSSSYEEGQFPRDVSFSASNTVNCKCTMVVINGDDTKDAEKIGE